MLNCFVWVLISKGRAKGGKHRAKQLGKEGYQEMGKKGGLSSSGESPEEKGVPIDESKFRTKSWRKTHSYQIPDWISTWTNEEQSVFQSGANRSRELDYLKCKKWHYEERASEELDNCKLYIWSLQALLILEAYEDSITVGQSCLPCSLYALCIHQFCRDGWRDSYCDPQNLMRSRDWREREGERESLVEI